MPRSRDEKKEPEVRSPRDGLRFYSALTHGIGAWLSTVGAAVLIVLSALVGNGWYLAASIVYGLCLMGLYTASTLYHALPLGDKGRRRLRKMDHIMIYMLIAGTYTPICLITLNGAWGWWLFGVIWFFAVAGTIVKLFWMNAPRWLTAVTYIAMGWMALIAVVPIVQSMQVAPLSLLAAGGLLYTTGAVCYARKWPGKDNPRFGFHEVFHIFVLLGSICHFVMIVLL